MKYQLVLVGSLEDCSAVERVLNKDKVHVLGVSPKVPSENFACDYIIICSKIDEKDISEFQEFKIVRYDFLRYCAYKISPESAYLDLRLRQRIDKGLDGVVTGLSYQQRGINYHKLDRNLVCMATPSQDLYLDFKSFCWIYDEVVVKRNREIKYCIIGMDFYRLWYDLSMSPGNNIRMLCYYKRLRCMHHWHELDHVMLKCDEDLKICEELMIDNYMDIDYCSNFHPELYYEKEDCAKYDPSDKEYKRDCEEVKKVFNKPYFSTFKENKEILERYIKFLYLHNIKILIYIPPFPHVFNSNTPKEMKNTTIEILLDFKRKYGFDVLDLSDNAVFTNEYFSDWSHLNQKGADAATDILNEYMKKIWDIEN